MHEQRRQARPIVGHLDRFDAGMADDGGGGLEQFTGGGVDGQAALGARVDETFAGRVVARRAQEARRRGDPLAFRLALAAARRDLVAHAGPFFEPGTVVADVILERAPDAMHLVDLDTGPRRGAEANEQAHGPAVVVGKIKERGVVFAANHLLLLLQGKRAAALVYTGFSPRMVTRRISRRSSGLKSVRACRVQRLSQITRSPARQMCS